MNKRDPQYLSMRELFGRSKGDMVYVFSLGFHRLCLLLAISGSGSLSVCLVETSVSASLDDSILYEYRDQLRFNLSLCVELDDCTMLAKAGFDRITHEARHSVTRSRWGLFVQPVSRYRSRRYRSKFMTCCPELHAATPPHPHQSCIAPNLHTFVLSHLQCTSMHPYLCTFTPLHPHCVSSSRAS